MENLKVNLEEEYKQVLDEVTQKYKYSDDLKSVLGKLLPAFLDGASYEKRELFYKTLRTTPIVVVPEESSIEDKELIDEVLGDPTPHIKEKEEDKGIYGNAVSAGAFVTKPVLDENLNLTGVKKFIFIRSFDTSKELFGQKQRYFERLGTGINVSHLIHELGHAYASEVNPYSIKDGVLTQRVGTMVEKFKITPVGDNKYESESIEKSGLFLEESLNTVSEQNIMAKYLGVSVDEVKQMYRGSDSIFIPSVYQGSMNYMAESLLSSPLGKDVIAWREQDDTSALDRINKAFSKTNFFEKREKIYKRMTDELGEEVEGESFLVTKNRIFNSPETERSGEALKIMEGDFFVDDVEHMTPVEMLDNTFAQLYGISSYKYRFGLDTYKKLLSVTCKEGYGLINQAKEKVLEKEAEEK